MSEIINTSDCYLDSYAWSHVLDRLPGEDLFSVAQVDHHLLGVVQETTPHHFLAGCAVFRASFTKMLVEIDREGSDVGKKLAINHLLDKCQKFGTVEDALAVVAKGAQLHPRYKKEVIERVIQFALEKNDLEGAKKAANLFPELHETAIGLIVHHLAVGGQIQEAKKLAGESVDQGSKLRMFIDIIKVQANSGDFNGAQESIEGIVNVDDKNWALEEAINICLKRGNLEEAKAFALTIPRPLLKDQILVKIAERFVAVKDFTRAKGVAADIDNEQKRDLLFVKVFKQQIADKDLAGAEETVKTFSAKDEGFAQIAEAKLELKDIQGALATAAQIEEVDVRDRTYLSIALALKTEDSTVAKDIVERIEGERGKMMARILIN